ncbi:S-layer homology domain-containing protein, partial [Schnuerera sp.]|uniref:S-layer homology domain-containing protein n=1 Tax=Schnuerera sp. TaxID=2794844 RepID=UPI002B8A567D
GLVKGLENNFADPKIPYNEARLSIKEIIKKYEDYLDNQNDIYRNSFISGYLKGFEKGYNEGVSAGSSTNKADVKTKYTDYADSLGLLLGEIYGHKDFYANKSANINRSLPSNKALTGMFNLDKLSYQDRYAFLNTFKGKFREGYQEGYGKANFKPMEISYEEGVAQGEYFGNILGRTSGTKDYFENKTRDYMRNIPSNGTIIREYSLNKDGKKYREGFLIGFRRAYEESYNESFRTMNVDEHRRSYEEGYEEGLSAGLDKGEIEATEDYYLKLENNWKRYFPTKSCLIREYSLSIESKNYRNGFFSGYLDGLAQGYGDKYRELSQETIEKKSKVEEVPISGGEVESFDNTFFLKIEKGTYYNPVIVKLDVLPDEFYSLDEGFIKVSDYYKINVTNKSYAKDNEKDIELIFEYYGKNNGGIYKLVNDKWLYIPSYIEDGYIKAFVTPNSFKGKANVYSVLIDKNSKHLLDIRDHWAKDEITAYQRRGIVSGYSDNTFRPDEKISKGDFLIILSKVYNWEIPNKDKTTDYEETISYAIDKGYISNIYKANEKVTYREMETIMRKVTGYENFHWYN